MSFIRKWKTGSVVSSFWKAVAAEWLRTISSHHLLNPNRKGCRRFLHQHLPLLAAIYTQKMDSHCRFFQAQSLITLFSVMARFDISFFNCLRISFSIFWILCFLMFIYIRAQNSFGASALEIRADLEMFGMRYKILKSVISQEEMV